MSKSWCIECHYSDSIIETQTEKTNSKTKRIIITGKCAICDRKKPKYEGNDFSYLMSRGTNFLKNSECAWGKISAINRPYGHMSGTGRLYLKGHGGSKQIKNNRLLKR